MGACDRRARARFTGELRAIPPFAQDAVVSAGFAVLAHAGGLALSAHPRGSVASEARPKYRSVLQAIRCSPETLEAP